MGLSIHYSGRFKEDASLSELINEVKDIAEICKWKYTVYHDQFPEITDGENSHNENIYGISFTPPECETVSICFLSNRRMSDPVQLMLYGKTEKENEREYLYLLAVKTQFAGIEIHKFIIELFRYLNKKEYFDNFKLIDEGEYWETGDEELLEHNFKKYSQLLDDFSFALENFPLNKGESFNLYFERIIEMVHKRNKKR